MPDHPSPFRCRPMPDSRAGRAVVADARDLLADPRRAAREPNLRILSWAVLHRARGSYVRQSVLTAEQRARGML